MRSWWKTKRKDQQRREREGKCKKYCGVGTSPKISESFMKFYFVI